MLERSRVADVLIKLRALGGRIWSQEGKVRVSAPPGTISDALWQELATHRDAIHEMLSRSSQAAALRPSPQARPAHLPLSYAQQQLWIADQLTGSAMPLTIVGGVRLRGDCSRDMVLRALQVIVARHEVLRTRFETVDESPAQVCENSMEIDLPMTDLRGLDREIQRRRLREIVTEEERRPFDLRHAPLLRCRLMQLDESDHVLVRATHHIIFDGWSEGVFDDELRTLLDAEREGRTATLPPLPLQYADYALWQRDACEAGHLAAGVAYWRQQLDPAPPPLDLFGRGRSRAASFVAGSVRISLAADLTRDLKRQARALEQTLFVSLVAGLAVTLSRYSAESDVAIGCPIADRPDPSLERSIGMFVNPVVLRVPVRPADAVRVFMASVRQITVDALTHRDVPFDRIVHEVAADRSGQANPLFNVLFVLQNTPLARTATADGATGSLIAPETRIRYGLEIYACERGDTIGISWLYDTAQFSREEISQLAADFETLLRSMVQQPERPVGLLGSRRRDVADSEVRRQPVETVARMVEARVEAGPDRVAIICGRESISYDALNRRANQLARWLMGQGAGPERVIAVALPRSAGLVVTLLAIAKTGAACLPLDPDRDPAGRAADTVRRAGAMLVITAAPFRDRFDGATSVASIDDPAARAIESERGDVLSDRGRAAVVEPDHPALILSTSGTSGRSKIVIGTQAGLANRLAQPLGELQRRSADRSLAMSSVSFVDGITSLLGPLVRGGTVVVTGSETSADFDRLVDLIHDEACDEVTLVPSVLRQMLGQPRRQRLDGVAIWVSSGEPLVAGDLQRFADAFPRAALLNSYGMSEASGDSTVAVCGSGPEVSIGAPIANTGLYVLDAMLERVPRGVSGELYVSGHGLARGYARNAGLTAARFVPALYDTPGERMYRTGDLVREQSDGALEYLGRADNQVKIRGVRVEPAEAEAALRALPGVADAAVVALRKAPVDALLAAFVLPRPLHAVDADDLRRQLGLVVPPQYVPTSVVIVEQLPKLASGKVDRAALSAMAQPPPAAVYRPPVTATEHLLCDLIAKILSVERVGLDDGFFRLGGHSLQAMQLVSRLSSATGIDLPITAVFESSNVAELAARMAVAQDGSAA